MVVGYRGGVERKSYRNAGKGVVRGDPSDREASFATAAICLQKRRPRVRAIDLTFFSTHGAQRRLAYTIGDSFVGAGGVVARSKDTYRRRARASARSLKPNRAIATRRKAAEARYRRSDEILERARNFAHTHGVLRVRVSPKYSSKS